MKNNNKIIKSSLLAVTLIAATSATAVLAAGPSDEVLLRQAKVREVVRTVVRNLMEFRKDTPLSDEQKTQIRDIVQTYHSDMRQQAETGKAAREAFRKAAAESPDSKETLAAAEAIGNAARDRALLAAKIRAEVRPLLTPEQQASIESTWKSVSDKVDAVIDTFN